MKQLLICILALGVSVLLTAASRALDPVAWERQSKPFHENSPQKARPLTPNGFGRQQMPHPIGSIAETALFAEMEKDDPADDGTTP